MNTTLDYIPYDDGEDRIGYVLWLDDETWAKMPAASDGENGTRFNIELLDRVTGKIHQAKEWISYDEDRISSFGEVGNSLSSYFYFWHYCGCHRLASIIENAPELEGPDEIWCDDSRFLVLKITAESMPDLVLYYEKIKNHPSSEKLESAPLNRG